MPEPLTPESPEADGMGDSFSIAGDTTTHNHYYQQQQQQQPVVSPSDVRQTVSPATTPPPAAVEPTWKTWAKRAALAAAVASGPAGAGVGYWLSQRGQQQPTVEQPQPGGYLQYEVDVGPPAKLPPAREP